MEMQLQLLSLKKKHSQLFVVWPGVLVATWNCCHVTSWPTKHIPPPIYS